VITVLLALVANLTVPTNSVEAAFQRADFRPIPRIEALPSQLSKALVEATRGERIANPKQKWQATDNLINPSLPRRRLILAGVSGKMSFVFYEHGGRGKHQHLLLFSGNPKTGFRLVRNLSMSRGLADIKGLKAYLADGKASPASHA
jgi:hypothetical protein